MFLELGLSLGMALNGFIFMVVMQLGFLEMQRLLVHLMSVPMNGPRWDPIRSFYLHFSISEHGWSVLCDMWFLFLRMRFGGSPRRFGLFYPCVSDYGKLVWLCMDMCGQAFLHLFMLPVCLKM
jgi:hypothetical protein